MPKTNARIPNRKLTGKHMMLVNGNGINPMQINRMVRIPKTMLRMDCELMGGELIGSFVSIIL
jgi:hypothetical protein